MTRSIDGGVTNEWGVERSWGARWGDRFSRGRGRGREGGNTQLQNL